MLESSKIIKKITNSIDYKIAVILGSGLTNFFEEHQILHTIAYDELKDFPSPTVKGHSGKLVIGKVGNENVICFYGRSHIYEGHNPSILINPIRVLKDIGCKLLIITNAAGSLKEEMPPGSLMAITDHINWSGYSPLIGPNNEKYGPRFSDMSDAYSIYYRQQLIDIAKQNKQRLFDDMLNEKLFEKLKKNAKIKVVEQSTKELRKQQQQ